MLDRSFDSLDHDAPVSPSRSGARLGDFALLRRLGRGSQGEVYEARQVSLGRLVALKVLPPYYTFSPERVLRFRREAEAGGRLDHPHIVGVHSVGVHEDCHYIAQELVPGGRTLADRIAEAREDAELPRDWYETIAQLFVRVAEAMQAAHSAGIVHRDLKPGNILITQDGSPKVADFGLAMVEDNLHRSITGELIGTPFYMSPEQGSGSRTGVDRRTDVFSLGVTLYEALTLQRPFDAETREKVVVLIQSSEPRDPRKLRPGVPLDLALICMKALEKRPERRYQSAGELADDLRRHLAHEPIRARPPGAAVRAGKWLRRHPVRTGFALTYVLVLGLLFKYWQETQRVDARETQLTGMVNNLVSKALLDPNGLLVRRPQPQPDPHAPILADIDSALRVAEHLDDFPDEQWYLFLLAGAHLRNNSLFERADEVLLRSLEAARTQFTRDEFGWRRVARSENELGKSYWWQRRLDEAEPLLRDARKHFAEERGAASEEVLSPTVELANVLTASGRVDEALELLQELHAATSDEGAAHERKVILAEHIGNTLMWADRYDEAERWLLGAYEASEGLYPEVERLELGGSLAKLFLRRGVEARAAGRTDEAAEADRRAEELFTTVIAGLGELPFTQLILADVQTSFGSFLNKHDRLAEARAVLEEALDSALRHGGPDDTYALNARNNLAWNLSKTGELVEAEVQYQEILASDARAGRGANLSIVMTALQNLGAMYCNAGRYPEAEEFAEMAVARTEPTDPKYGKRVDNLAKIRAFMEAAASTEASPSSP